MNIPTGIVSIEVDHTGGIDVRFKGKQGSETMLLGALKVAEDYLLRRVLKKNAMSEYESPQPSEESCPPEKKEYSASKERTVSRNEALNTYIDARTKLEQRIRVIADSSQETTFTVDDDLLSSL